MNKKIKSLLTLAKFRKWLTSRPDSEEFYYADCHNCAIARFLKDNKVQVAPEGATVVSDCIWTRGDDVKIPLAILRRMDAFVKRVSDAPSTMGLLKTFFKK